MTRNEWISVLSVTVAGLFACGMDLVAVKVSMVVGWQDKIPRELVIFAVMVVFGFVTVPFTRRLRAQPEKTDKGARRG